MEKYILPSKWTRSKETRIDFYFFFGSIILLSIILYFLHDSIIGYIFITAIMGIILAGFYPLYKTKMDYEYYANPKCVECGQFTTYFKYDQVDTGHLPIPVCPNCIDSYKKSEIYFRIVPKKKRKFFR